MAPMWSSDLSCIWLRATMTCEPLTINLEHLIHLIGDNCKWSSIPRVRGELAEDKGQALGCREDMPLTSNYAQFQSHIFVLRYLWYTVWSRDREPQVLDYQTQQYKLFPLLASAYAYWFSGLKMRRTYFMLNYEIQQGNTERLPEVTALFIGIILNVTAVHVWYVWVTSWCAVHCLLEK